MSKKRVYVIGEFSFPTGLASTERILNISYGFAENGYSVTIIPLLPNYTSRNGMYERLAFSENIQYIQNDVEVLKKNDRSTKIGNRKFIEKIKWFTKSYYNVIRYGRRIGEMNVVNEGSIAFLYGMSFLKLYPIFSMLRLKQCFTIFDLVEIPESYQGAGGKLSPVYWDWILAAKYIPKRCYGLSAISNFIYNRYKKENPNIVIAPATTGIPDEIPKFKNYQGSKLKVLYLGALIKKDSPEYMFNMLRHYQNNCDGPKIELIVAGRYEQKEFGRKWMSFVEMDETLSATVKFIGELSNEEVKYELDKCDAIILLRRNSLVECASFPTRLVEFLRSGRPLISSDFGDIGNYLRSKIDAILLPVNDVTLAAQVLLDCISDTTSFKSLAINGYSRLGVCFDRKKVVKNLLIELNLEDL